MLLMSVPSAQVPPVWVFSCSCFQKTHEDRLCWNTAFHFLKTYLGVNLSNKISLRQKKNLDIFNLKSFLLKSFLLMEITPNFRAALQWALQKLDISRVLRFSIRLSKHWDLCSDVGHFISWLWVLPFLSPSQTQESDQRLPNISTLFMTAPQSQSRKYQSYHDVHQSMKFIKSLGFTEENLGMFAIYFHSEKTIKCFKSEFALLQTFLCCKLSFSIQLCLKLSFSVSFKTVQVKKGNCEIVLNVQVKKGN